MNKFFKDKEENTRSEKTRRLLNESPPWFINYGTYIVSAIMIVLVIILLEYLSKYDVIPLILQKWHI